MLFPRFRPVLSAFNTRVLLDFGVNSVAPRSALYSQGSTPAPAFKEPDRPELASGFKIMFKVALSLYWTPFITFT